MSAENTSKVDLPAIDDLDRAIANLSYTKVRALTRAAHMRVGR